MREPDIKGIAHLWSETGTEGGYWAIQDERFIIQKMSGVQWDYEGLYVLKNGDYLKVYNEDGTVAWEGTVNLAQQDFNAPQPSYQGLWIHNLPNSPSLEQWGELFIPEHKAEVWKVNHDKT